MKLAHRGQWRRFDRMFRAAHNGKLLRYAADRKWLLAYLNDYYAKNPPEPEPRRTEADQSTVDEPYGGDTASGLLAESEPDQSTVGEPPAACVSCGEPAVPPEACDKHGGPVCPACACPTCGVATDVPRRAVSDQPTVDEGVNHG